MSITAPFLRRQCNDRFRKPRRWALTSNAVNSKWRWFWDNALVVVPMWEAGGDRVFDFARPERIWTVDLTSSGAVASWTVGPFGPWILMPADNASLNVSAPVEVLGFTDPNRLTIIAKVKTNDLTGRHTIWGAANVNTGVQLEVGPGNGGTNRVVTIEPGTFVSETVDNSIAPNKEQVIIYTRSGSGATHRIYVEGVEKSLATNSTASYGDPSAPHSIGSRKTNAPRQSFDGPIDYVAVLDFDISPAQAAQISADHYGPLRPMRQTPMFFNILEPDEGEIHIVTVTDGIQFDDPDRRSELSKTDLDTALLDVARQAILQKFVEAAILIGDSDASHTARDSVATDTVLLADQRTSQLGKTAFDNVLLDAVRRSILEKTAQATLLMGDGAAAARGVGFSDALMFSDSRTSEIDKTILNSLLLSDVVERAIHKLALDGLFLTDSDEQAIISAATLLTITDNLLILDLMEKAHAKGESDSVLLKDNDFRSTFRLLLDSLLAGDEVLLGVARTELTTDGFIIDDRTEKTRRLTAVENVLLSDALIKALQLLHDEGLLMDDSSTRSLIESAAQALVFAILKAVDLLGITIGFQADLLGGAIGAEDLLHYDIGWQITSEN